MEKTVLFRDFEERDIGFIYRCKNDEKLNSMIVGQFHPFTYEEATKWVRGCMGEHESYKFWAICTNDEEKRIVGWASMANIDMAEKTANFHGIVIADQDYRDGFAWIESYLFVYNYAFETLKLERVYGKALTDHIASQTMRLVMFGKTIDVCKNGIIKDGVYHDISIGVLTSDVYFEHKKQGDYTLYSILKRIKKVKKEVI